MSNVPISSLQNALAGGVLGNANGMSSQQMQLTMSQADMMRQYTGAIAGGGIRAVPRAFIEVDKVSNGFVFKCGNDLLIAKDIEELQQQFVAAIASMLLEDR